jgi:pentatricopeptide repeat protein
MLEKKVVPDVISYSELISAYCQKKDMYNADLRFHGMLQQGYSPDVTVCTVLMNGYCRAVRFQDELFYKMIRSDINPDVVAYTVLLDGFLKETLWQGREGLQRREAFLSEKSIGSC